MSEPKPWQSLVDVAILHPTRAQILVQQNATGRTLPSLPLPKVWTEPLARINETVQQRLGIKTLVLHKLAEVRDEAQRLVHFLYLLENHSPAWTTPPDAQWLRADELAGVTFAQPAHQLAISTWLTQIEQGVTPPRRVQWAQAGWQHGAETWIHSQLDQLGYAATGPIQQIKNWFISCILRIPTDRGNVYFKATNASSLMVNEAQMTQALADMFPQVMPIPLAIEPTQDWLLLADFGEEIGWTAPVAVQEQVLQAFGRFQIETASHLDALLAIGCIDRRLAKLATQVDPLINDPAMLAYVDTQQQAQLQTAAPALKTCCSQLDQYQVPATLVHGDLHMSNVAQRPTATAHDGYLFFDWSDACITHPFLDMISILHEPDQALQQRLRDSYLALWTPYEPTERLLEMWPLAYPLCALHQAVSYQHILHNTEDACKHELDWAMPFWFGKILESLVAA